MYGNRNYSPENLQEALHLVLEDGMSIYKASKITGVPQTTLKDRKSGRIDLNCISTGHPAVFSDQEELKIKNHVIEMASMGYGYSRRELLQLSSDMAHFLGKLPNDKQLSERWLYAGFLKRHRDITFIKPRPLNISRAKSVTEDAVEQYFQNLNDILVKYNLLESPELIFNIDESGFSPEHSAPKIATAKGHTPEFISSPRSTMVTCIGACSAVGNFVPPFLIFKGKRLSDDLKEGASAGCGFAMSETGWSNSLLFQEYLKKHFLKFVPKHEGSKVLVLYDGSSIHFSAELIDWALTQDIVLFVIPPHSSHLLQPLDIGCFSPLKKAYNSLCHSYMKEHPGQIINKYVMTSLICKSYTSAMTPLNIKNSFAKTGIYPFDPKKPISPTTFKPCKATTTTKPSSETDDIEEVLNSRLPNPVITESRKRSSNHVGGMAITEGKG